MGRGAAAQHRGIGGSVGTCRFRHPSGGHRRRWTYATAGYDHPHAGRQNHSDRRESAIRRLPARMRDSRHRFTGGTGSQERAAAFPCQSGTRPCEDPGRQSLLERVQRCSGFRDRVHPQRIVAAGRIGNRPDTDGRRIRAESRADLADHPMGGAQIRGIRMAAAKPDR